MSVDASSAAFEADLAERNLVAARMACTLVAVLMPAGVLLDLVVHRDFLAQFALYRAGASVFSLAFLGFTWAPWARRHAFWFGCAPAVIAAVGIELMVLELGGAASPYYAGLNLVILGIGFVFTWRWQETALVCGLVDGIWLAPALATLKADEVGAFANNAYFLGLTSVIAVASNTKRFTLARREHEAKFKLAQTSAELASTLEQLKLSASLKTTFFTNVSHELRTPLTLILAPLETLLSGNEASGRVRESLELMYRNGQRLLENINDLLSLSRVEANRERLKLVDTELPAFLRTVIDSSRGLAEKNGVEIQLQNDGIVPAVPLDQEKVEKIFLNLLSNALKFTGGASGRDARVIVRCGVNASTVFVSVEDTGVGIPPEELSHLFERYHQIDGGPTRGYGGTGIGLALVKELTELHLGSVSVRSVLGQGSTFTFELPLSAAVYPPERLDRRQRSRAVIVDRRSEEALQRVQSFLADPRLLDTADVAPSASAPEITEGEPRPLVLVADDNRDMLSYLGRMLSSEFRVKTAENGDQAFRMALQEVPSIVISDVMMPGRTGDELLKDLKSEPRTRHVPIILLTAKAGVESKVGSLELGADDYLTKPFHFMELKARIRSLLHQRKLERELQEKNEYLSKLNFDLLLSKKEVFLGTIDALAFAIDAKDPYTHGHSRRVSLISDAVARDLGLSESDCEKTRIAAVLHDVGKIGIPESILRKPSRLTAEEHRIIESHPEIGHRMLSSVKELSYVSKCILHHHERFDGGGYPSGLCNHNIPVQSRIIAVCDTYDAMTSDRCYRKGLGHQAALEELSRCSGKQFDPDCVRSFMRLYEAAPPVLPVFTSVFEGAR